MTPTAMVQNTRAGIWLMVATTLVFAVQDGLSRHLAASYPVQMVVMIRFWFFAAFVMAMAARQSGGLRAAVRTRYPVLQALRGALLAVEICVFVAGFVKLGLVESHAAFASYPLLIAALSGPVLGERVGWRRWCAILAGFAGVLIILQPGVAVFSPWALVPLLAALLFAVYGLLTRYVARRDAAMVSYFWTGIGGAGMMTLLGIGYLQPMTGPDMAWMALLCCTACLGHWLLIRAFAVAEASAIQPFAYLQLVWASAIGVVLFAETVRTNVAVGAGVVVAAGVFTLWRQRVRARQGLAG